VRLPRAVRNISDPIHLEASGFAERLHIFPLLDEESACVLVTSARLYQDALWLAESEPHLAWLFLVSAVETVAHHWRRRNRNHVERLTDSRPKLVEMLRAEGGDKLVRKVALEIVDYTGAGLKFADFIMTFDPGPPADRRIIQLSVAWTPLHEAVRLVYQWRSRALHGGTPFPFPMCDAPLIHGEWWMGFPQEAKGAIAERPLGLAAGTGGAMWDNEETPMAAASEPLSWLVAEQKKGVLESFTIHSDDTSLLCQENFSGAGKRRSFLWAYVGFGEAGCCDCDGTAGSAIMVSLLQVSDSSAHPPPYESSDRTSARHLQASRSDTLRVVSAVPLESARRVRGSGMACTVILRGPCRALRKHSRRRSR
jgi:hypothetical protein